MSLDFLVCTKRRKFRRYHPFRKEKIIWTSSSTISIFSTILSILLCHCRILQDAMSYRILYSETWHSNTLNGILLDNTSCILFYSMPHCLALYATDIHYIHNILFNMMASFTTVHEITLHHTIRPVLHYINLYYAALEHITLFGFVIGSHYILNCTKPFHTTTCTM